MIWILLSILLVVVIVVAIIVCIFGLISPVLHFRKEINAYNRHVQTRNKQTAAKYNIPAIAKS